MAVYNKKFNIVLPDGRTETWSQEDMEQYGGDLFAKYAGTKVTSQEDYQEGATYSPESTYDISFADGRRQQMSDAEWQVNGEGIRTNYPDAKISVNSPYYADDNFDLLRKVGGIKSRTSAILDATQKMNNTPEDKTEADKKFVRDFESNIADNTYENRMRREMYAESQEFSEFVTDEKGNVDQDKVKQFYDIKAAHREMDDYYNSLGNLSGLVDRRKEAFGKNATILDSDIDASMQNIDAYVNSIMANPNLTNEERSSVLTSYNDIKAKRLRTEIGELETEGVRLAKQGKKAEVDAIKQTLEEKRQQLHDAESQGTYSKLAYDFDGAIDVLNSNLGDEGSYMDRTNAISQLILRDKAIQTILPKVNGLQEAFESLVDVDDSVLYSVARELYHSAKDTMTGSVGIDNGSKFMELGTSFKEEGKSWVNNPNSLLNLAGAEHAIDMQIRRIAMKLQAYGANLNDTELESATLKDAGLTDGESALWEAYMSKMYAETIRKDDRTYGQKGAKISMDAIPFMMEMMVTHNITTGATRDLEAFMMKGLHKLLNKEAAVGTNMLLQGLTRYGGHYAANLASRMIQTGVGVGLAQSTANAKGRALIETNPDGTLKYTAQQANRRGYLDNYKEWFTEIAGEQYGKWIGDALHVTHLDDFFDKYVTANISSLGHDWLKYFNRGKALTMAGFNGFGEIAEEIEGALIDRVVFGDEESWEEFWKKDNLVEMLIGFAPMMVFGGAMSGAQAGYHNYQINKNMSDAQKAYMEAHPERNWTNSQWTSFFKDLSAKVGADGSIKGVADQLRQFEESYQDIVINNSSTLSDQEKIDRMESAQALGKALLSEVAITAQNQAMRQQEMEDMRDAIQDGTGQRFWRNDGDGNYVTTGTFTNSDGSMFDAYILSENGDEIAWVDNQGKRGISKRSALSEMQSHNLDEYLGSVVDYNRQANEQNRMNAERQSNLARLTKALATDPKIKTTIEGQQVEGQFVGWNNGKGLVNIGDNVIEMSVEEMARGIAKPFDASVFTDEQIAQNNAGRQVKKEELNRKFAGKVIDINGKPVTFRKIYQSPFVDENGEQNVYVVGYDENGMQQRYVMPVSELESQVGRSVTESSAAPQQSATGASLPMKTDANGNQVVDESALWQRSVAEWADYNTKKQNDGGVDSWNYVNGVAIPLLSNEIAELENSLSMEADFGARENIKNDILAKRQRLQELKDYQKKAVADAIAPLNTNNTKVVISTSETITEDMENAGCSNRSISQVRRGMRIAKVPAFFDQVTNTVFMVADNASSLEDVRVSFVHEDQHRDTNESGLANLLLAKMGGATEENYIRLSNAVAALSGSEFYTGKDAVVLADEFISYAVETAFKSGQDMRNALESRGINDDFIINFVENIDNEREEARAAAARLSQSGGNVDSGLRERVGGEADGISPNGGSGAVEGQGSGSLGAGEEQVRFAVSDLAQARILDFERFSIDNELNRFHLTEDNREEYQSLRQKRNDLFQKVIKGVETPGYEAICILNTSKEEIQSYGLSEETAKEVFDAMWYDQSGGICVRATDGTFKTFVFTENKRSLEDGIGTYRHESRHQKNKCAEGNANLKAIIRAANSNQSLLYDLIRELGGDDVAYKNQFDQWLNGSKATLHSYEWAMTSIAEEVSAFADSKIFKGQSLAEIFIPLAEKYKGINLNDLINAVDKAATAEYGEYNYDPEAGRYGGNREYVSGDSRSNREGKGGESFNELDEQSDRPVQDGGSSVEGGRMGDAVARDSEESSQERSQNDGILEEVESDPNYTDEARQFLIEEQNAIEAPAEATGDEIRFTIREAQRLEDKSVAFWEKTQKYLTEDELKTANGFIATMASIMEPYLEARSEGKRVLPEEVFGKGYTTIFNNGSYGRTMENTTKCLRTLSYNDFVDAVKEQLGRPLTTIESFLASQMLYDIAVDPQCLYCYVSLDRKAYDDFLLRFIQDRDKALEAYRAADIDPTERLKPQSKKKGERKDPKYALGDSPLENVYKAYLDGREDSPNQRERFNTWLDAETDPNKRLVSLEDLTTEEKRSSLKQNEEKYFADQIADAEKYAQGASWAKKQEDYRSYNGELLEMSPRVVNMLRNEYGLRFYSFSEYSPAFIVENMQMVRDASLRGLNGLGYTKELDFVRVFAPTGMNINMSCFGRWSEDGQMIMDTRQGADWNEVKELREKYPNAGAVFVATDDAMVEWALDQDWIDVIIPFHIVRTGTEVSKFYEWVNHSMMQADTNTFTGRNQDIMPTEHHNDKNTFLALCASHLGKDGSIQPLKPRFADLVLPASGQSVVAHPNYMKLVNETRRSIDETTPLKPVFDLASAVSSFDEFVERGGYYGDWYTVDTEGYKEAVNQVVEDIKAGRTAKDVDYGRQDIKMDPEKLSKAARRQRQHRQHGNTPLTQVQLTEEQKDAVRFRTTYDVETEFAPRFAEVRADYENKKKEILGHEGKFTPAEWKEHREELSRIGKERDEMLAPIQEEYIAAMTAAEEEERLNAPQYDVVGEPDAERGKALFDAAKEQFGTTTDFNEAGYIVPDGDMIDLSGKNNGGEAGHRQNDHRDIGSVISDRKYSTATEYMDDFINEGAIRIAPEMGLVSLANKPTKEQKSRLRDYLYKHNGETIEIELLKGGKTEANPVYRERTAPSRIVNDINAFYDEGIVPEGNVLFRAIDITPEVRQEMNRIEAMARINGTYMKAPNGADTKLNNEQWAMVRTQAFRDWFGDWENDPENASKVVDENGEPMVVYHGTMGETESNHFNEFDPWNGAIWFAANEGYANVYAGISMFGEEPLYDSKEKPMVYKTFLSIKNPFIAGNTDATDAEGYRIFRARMARELGVSEADIDKWATTHEGHYDDYTGVIEEDAAPFNITGSKGFRDRLIEHGYDGIAAVENGGVTYGSFSPNQIKSATDNTGEFSRENDDIRFSVTPEQDEAFRKAYEANDTAAAQQMVKDAFKAAFPNTKVVDENGDPLVVYHGSPSHFNSFDERTLGMNTTADSAKGGFFFTSSEKLAGWFKDTAEVRGEGYDIFEENLLDYVRRNATQEAVEEFVYMFDDHFGDEDESWRENARERALEILRDRMSGYYSDMEQLKEDLNKFMGLDPTKIYATFLNIENPIIDDEYRDYVHGKVDSRMTDVINRAKAEGNDGVIFTDINELGGRAPQYVVFNPAMIKSADPFTFDDNGELIPLSERFNPENNDIRFRMSGENATFDELSNLIGSRLNNEGEGTETNVVGEGAEGNPLADLSRTGEDGEIRDILFRAIGEEGAQNLDDAGIPNGRAKSRMENLALAISYKGNDPLTIKKLTGWEFSDGQWKYEEPDFLVSDLNLEDGKKLSEVIDDKSLFVAYPQLSDIEIRLVNNGNAGVAYDNIIEIDPNYSANGHTKEQEQRLTLIHEIQHMIQKYEGWPTGTSMDNPDLVNAVDAALPEFKNDLWNLVKKTVAVNLNLNPRYEGYEATRKFVDKWGIKPTRALNSLGDLRDALINAAYRNNRGEIDARISEARADYSEEELNASLRDEQNIRFSVRTKPAPEKTGIGYKVFYQKDGKLYPPMVANPNGADTPVGVWLDADAAPVAGSSKTGRPQVKQGGKGTQGGSGMLAYRPGWHLGEIPYALQFNRKDENGERTLFPKDFVWAEVEYAMDNNYQEEAEAEGMTENGKFRHSYAGLKRVPEDGYYTYRTNPNPETDPWIITGSMKVTRILDKSEVDELVRNARREPQRVEGDGVRFKASNDNQKVFVSNAAKALDKIPMKSGNAQAWINKLQQAGGLKKEEDKWLGLSTWLKEHDGNISKDEVAQFIAENKVQIEEVKYSVDGYDNPINDTRRRYTTDGLDNKREIALVVPTIDPYKQGDEIHFGDAGEGRAVAWIRFGDARSLSSYQSVVKEKDDWEYSMRKKYNTRWLFPENMSEEDAAQLAKYEAMVKDADMFDNQRVLVIDEVQSKRHQDGKEQGYRSDANISKEEFLKLSREENDLVFDIAKRAGKSGDADFFDIVDNILNGEIGSEEERQKVKEYEETLSAYAENTLERVPDAPFRDNWHELAMKRMLRLAAEEGYDKIAWTNGDMQADRYGIGGVVDKITSSIDGDNKYVAIYRSNGSTMDFTVNPEGVIIDGEEYTGKSLSDVVGKSLADELMSVTPQENYKEFSGNNLRIGGEGMRFFYDQKLVNWMNKYGKQWGVSVQDLELPSLDNSKGWHSIDVTPEMKRSVMGGQVMFKAGPVAQMRMKGMAEYLGERMTDFTNTVITTKDIFTKEQIDEISEVALTHVGAYNFAINQFFARLAEKDQLSADELDAAQKVANILAKIAGVEEGDITANDYLWFAYEDAHRNDRTLDEQIARQQRGREMGQRRDVAPEMSLEEYLAEADKARDDIKAQYDAMRAMVREMDDINKAMGTRANYDRDMVGRMVKLAEAVLTSRLLDQMSNGQVKRLMGILRRATSMRDVTSRVNELYNLILTNQLRNMDRAYEKLLARKASKVDSHGVVAQGALDVDGQRVMTAYKGNVDNVMVDEEGRMMPSLNLADLMAEAADKMTSDDASVAHKGKLDYMGLEFAKRYIEGVGSSIAEEKNLRRQMDDLIKERRDGNIDATAYRQEMKELRRALVENKAERVVAYTDLIRDLMDLSNASHSLALQFMEGKQQRIAQIHHEANSDMEGRDDSEHSTADITSMQRFYRTMAKFPMLSLGTFDQMLRMIGSKSVNGEGYLWNRFMRGWVDATGKEYKAVESAFQMLDAKVSEVFGKDMRWSDLYSIEKQLPGRTLTFKDGREMKDHEVKQGNLLYILLADQMSDGRMKLRHMGITEGMIEDIRKSIDPRFLELGEWIVKEFLPSRRDAYNEVHERMFGAPMSKVENYFPLKVNSRSRNKNVDVNQAGNEQAIASTITGNIIKRVRNNTDLDILNADAFSLVIEHVQKMEHWAAFAEWNQDLSTLLSYKKFENRMKNIEWSAYGIKEDVYKAFENVARIAAGSYTPKVSDADKMILAAGAGVTAAKISLRVWTALKQFLSSPAYFSEVNPLYLVGGVAKGWSWAMDNLPMFEKRWKSRQAGDHILKAAQGNISKLQETASRIGMTPNALVDAFTVSIGSYAIYKTKYDKYIKMGFDADVADSKAKQDAVILYNETQQSNESAFLSQIQSDRGFVSAILSLFRNSSMGYTRQVWDAVRNLKRRYTPGYRKESIEFMTKQLIREGLSEREARKGARSMWEKQGVKDYVRIGIFGYVLPFFWSLSAALPYLMFGDDDDKKKKLLGDVAKKSVFGIFEGLVAGNVLAESLSALVWEKKGVNELEPSFFPLFSDIKQMVQRWDSDKAAALNDIVNLGTQVITGVNMQTFTDMMVAVVDACDGDLGMSREALLLALRIVNAPQSSIEQLYIDEIDMKALDAKNLTIPELAERYARYKTNKVHGIFAGMDREKAIKKYEKRFNDLAAERLYEEDLDTKYIRFAEQADAMDKEIKELRGLSRDGDEKADEELTKIFLSDEFGSNMRLKSYLDDIKSETSAVVTSESRDEMRSHLDRINELKRELSQTFDENEGSTSWYKDKYFQYSKGLLPHMAQLEKKYQEEYKKESPEYAKAMDEYQERLDNAANDSRTNKEQLDSLENLKHKYQYKNDNGRWVTIPGMEELVSGINSEMKEVRENGTSKQKVIDKINKEMKITPADYMPREILESPEFQAYLKFKDKGRLSGNTFKFYDIDEWEQNMKNAADTETESTYREKVIDRQVKIAHEINDFINRYGISE